MSATAETTELRVEHHHDTIDDALVAALGELTDPKASETADVKTREGSYSYAYAKLSTIMQTVRPVLARHELCVVQLVETVADELSVTTLVRHSSGGSISSGTLTTRMLPNAQQIGSVVTYFRRYQLCALLGIAPEDDSDDDGRAASKTPTAKRATTKRRDPNESSAQQRVDRDTPPAQTRRVAQITDMQRRHIMAMFNSLGLSGDDNRAARLAYTSNAIGREIETTNDITRDEARQLIEVLIADTQPADDDGDAYASTGDYS